MAITIPNNQSLGFNITGDSCCFTGRYCQPIQTDDACVIQTSVNAVNNFNRVLQGEFDASSLWTLGAGWSIGSGKLSATNISGTTAQSAKLHLSANRVYLVQTAITVTSAGSAAAGEGWRIRVNDDYLQMPNSIPSGDGHNASLTASWFYSPTSITSDIVEFSTDETTIDFEVGYVRIYEVSGVGLTIHNSDSQVEQTYDSFSSPNSIKYIYEGGQVFTGMIKSVLITGEYSYSELSLICNLYIDNWASLLGSYVGCGYVKIHDIAESGQRVINGTFTDDLNYWTEGAQWSWDAAKAYYNPPSLPYVAGTLSQNIYLKQGYVYDFSFFLTNVGVTGGCNVSIDYNDGGGSVLLGTFIGVGTPHTAEIDLTDWTGTYITLYFYEYQAEDDFKLDAVSIIAKQKVGVETDCLSFAASHGCTIKLYATNDDNAFGFDYSLAFAHTLRVSGRIDLVGYPEEKEDYRFSDNSRSLLYSQSEKEYQVSIGDAPEYIHDCIRQMRLNDDFRIDSDMYIVSGDYELRTRRTSTNMQAVFSVKDKEGISSNYSCS